MSGLFAAKGTFETQTGRELQSIDSVGFRPTVVMAWWAPTPAEGSRRGNRGGIGFWTQAASASVAWRSADQEAEAQTAQVGADAALIGLDGPEPEIAMRADLESFHEEGLTLRYTTRPSTPWLVHFLALGGPAVENGRVGWASPKAIAARAGTWNSGLVLMIPAPAAEIDTVTRDLIIGLGVQCARDRAVAGYFCRDGARPGNARGAQRSRTAVLDWPELEAESHKVCYLHVDGIQARVGTAVSPMGEGTTYTRVGFRPDVLLLFSWGLPRSSQWKNMGRLCVGGAAGGRSGCVGWDDRDGDPGETMTHVRSSTEFALMVADSQSDDLHAHASLASIDDLGFTLDWLSDRRGRECVYVALTEQGLAGRDRLARRARAFVRPRRG